MKNAIKLHGDHRAFTLIELLLVMAILVILLSFIFVKVRPLFWKLQVSDIHRKNDVLQMERAFTQAMIDGKKLPSNIPSREEDAKWICQYTMQGIDCIDPPIEGVDISFLVPVYIPDIPHDPSMGTGEPISGYKVYRNGSFFIFTAPYLGQQSQ